MQHLGASHLDGLSAVLDVAVDAVGARGWSVGGVHTRDWTLAGVIAAVARGRVLVLAAQPEIALVAAAFGHAVVSEDQAASASALGTSIARALGLPCRWVPRAHAVSARHEYDTVVMIVPPDTAADLKPILDVAVDACRPGGRLVVRTPSSDDAKSNLKSVLRSYGGTMLHTSRRVSDRWLLAWVDLPGGLRAHATPEPVPQAALDSIPDGGLVSVVIPTFDRAHLLRRTLDAVARQTYPHLEVIVVDDGSSDDTRSVVRRHPLHPAYVRQSNRGMAAAVNTAVSLATGRYIWIADDDDLPLPHKAAQHIRVLMARPDTAMVYSDGYHFVGSPRNLLHHARAVDFHAGTQLPTLLDLELGTGQNAIYRADVIREVGPFDERLFRSQTLDMSLRIARRFPVQWLHFPTFLYRVHLGVRGPASDRFPVTENEDRWLRHNQRIYRKVYWTVPLAEIAPSIGDGTDRVRVAAGLLVRAKILLKRRLDDYALLDAQQAWSELKAFRNDTEPAPWRDLIAAAIETDRVATEHHAFRIGMKTRRLLIAACRRHPEALLTILEYFVSRARHARQPEAAFYAGHGLALFAEFMLRSPSRSLALYPLRRLLRGRRVPRALKWIGDDHAGGSAA